MRLELFNRVHTVLDMKKNLNLLQGIAEEHGVPYESMLRVTDTPYTDLTYAVSSSKNGYIISHYFTYEDSETGLHGVCELPCRNKNLIEWCKPEYNQLITIHPCLWLCLREDSTYDVNMRGATLLSGVQSYDVLDLAGCLQFLQLELSTGTCLICLDMWDSINGVYPISSKEQFEDWFQFYVSKRGYEEKLDNIAISQLFQIYFEVINTIFGVSRFIPISI